MNSLSDLTHEQILEVAGLVARRNELLEGEAMWDAQYMQMNENYARVLNEKYDLEVKLKEVGL